MKLDDDGRMSALVDKYFNFVNPVEKSITKREFAYVIIFIVLSMLGITTLIPSIFSMMTSVLLTMSMIIITASVIGYVEIEAKMEKKKKDVGDAKGVDVDIMMNLQTETIDVDVSKMTWYCPACDTILSLICDKGDHGMITGFLKSIGDHVIVMHDATGKFPIFNFNRYTR